ncbi:outer membrane receptor for ferrienterochelin and colicins [Catalinimonas alkaloidigena]|uniref:Outer membrane receptor for ferrienterochelin and colicins n=1 Tax=Catalinimonas alkaloidigena TaxID=1075417 RepID=A0A1G9KDV2_9BACT|nr:TonB-dependent receptor [Catalinimonas alkaloidigena]SDL47871.1 outer membrane receptor for ferrienterochelin and colicins [Catalinimonas alkaloidigena]
MRSVPGILLFLFGWLPFQARAQTVQVRDRADDRPLADAYVVFTTLRTGAAAYRLTDQDGHAQSPFAEPVQVETRLIGYRTRTDTLQPDQTYTLYLEADVQNLDEVVVTGTYQPSPRHEVLQRTRVIGAQRIQQQGALTLPDVLRNELNIGLSRDGVLGTSVSLQGLGGENVKILIDGVPVVGRQDGILDLNQLQLDDIARIEIVEGPMSVKYGADALAGVINLITKEAQEGWELGVQSHTESARQYLSEHEGTHRQSLSGSYHTGKATLQGRGGRYFFGGVPQPGVARARIWNPKQQHFGTAQVGYTFRRLKLHYKLDGLDEQIYSLGAPRYTGTRLVATDDRFQVRRLTQVLSAAAPQEARLRWDVFVSRQDFLRARTGTVKDLVTLHEQARGGSDSDTSRLVNYHSRGSLIKGREDAWLGYEVGYEVDRETGRGARIRDGQQTLYDVAVFASAELQPVPRLLLKPGLRLAYNSQYQAPPVPSLNVKYDLSDAWALRFTYGRGFRAPSLSELYLEFMDINHNVHGNPDLRAEYSHHLGLSSALRWERWGLDWQTELSLFYNDVRDKISLIQDTLTNDAYPVPRYLYFNIDRFRSQGGQWELRARRQRLEAGVGVGYTGRLNQYEAAYTTEAPRFFYSPQLSATLSYRPFARGPQLSLFYKRTGRTPLPGLTAEGQLVTYQQPAYAWLDASAVQSWWDDRLTLTLGVRNLLDVTNVRAGFSDSAHDGGSQTLLAVGRSGFFRLQFLISNAH